MTTDISVGVRWDPLNGANGDQPMEGDFEFEYDGGNSSSRLFERSRIRALAGNHKYTIGSGKPTYFANSDPDPCLW